jgi:hypothetical protein
MATHVPIVTLQAAIRQIQLAIGTLQVRISSI